MTCNLGWRELINRGDCWWRLLGKSSLTDVHVGISVFVHKKFFCFLCINSTQSNNVKEKTMFTCFRKRITSLITSYSYILSFSWNTRRMEKVAKKIIPVPRQGQLIRTTRYHFTPASFVCTHIANFSSLKLKGE